MKYKDEPGGVEFQGIVLSRQSRFELLYLPMLLPEFTRKIAFTTLQRTVKGLPFRLNHHIQSTAEAGKTRGQQRAQSTPFLFCFFFSLFACNPRPQGY